MKTTNPLFPGCLANLRPDCSTPQGRSLAFSERIAELTTGCGMNFDEAVRAMQGNRADAALLEAMGANPTVCEKEHDLSTPEGRKRLFDQRVDMLMTAKEKGGEGLTFDEAIERMRCDPVDQSLLSAMGATHVRTPDPSKV